MSTFKVIKTKIEVFPHPNAEKLQIGKVGNYQVVVQKGLYNGGEDVVFAPEKSILTGVLEAEYKNYLKGPENNRVGSIRLRDELSCGIIIPPHLVKEQSGKYLSELPYDEDLSEILGISKYVPPIPREMAGEAIPIEFDLNGIKHDVEQFGVYASNFIGNERVIITEKLHGSQCTAYSGIDEEGTEHRWVTTKNYNSQGLCLVDTPSQFYWLCTRDIQLWEMIESLRKELNCNTVQVFGEALPCQGLKYGFVNPTMLIFGVAVDGVNVPFDQLPEEWQNVWVPILYDGPYKDIDKLRKLALGNEQVSGDELHIKEGIVIRPYQDRRAKDGTWLKVKVINPSYKETGEEFN
jgi:RNA ligase (TIGR02306 family)